MAPPSKRKSSDTSPKKLSSPPWFLCSPQRYWVLVATFVRTLGWVIWKRLAVVINFPQSTSPRA